MKLLTQADNLETYLRRQSDKSVRVVTAFAMGTEGLVQHMIKANRSVELIVGTINNFSSPEFFETLAKEADIDFHVDFRGGNSVHWKLALIEPSTIVIGSANLTKRGVGLDRDTCVVIEDLDLYRRYVKMINALKTNKDVISSNDESFDRRLIDYRSKHEAMQHGLRIAEASAPKTSSLKTWLESDVNQQINLYIWDEFVSKVNCDTAKEIVKNTLGVTNKTEVSIFGESNIRDVFTYDEQPSKPPFDSGDIVLCCNLRGSYMDFYTFDIVERGMIRDEDGDDYDGYYMISLKRTRYRRPFDLRPHVSALKALIMKIVDGKEAGKVVVKRRDLEDLLG